MSSVHSASTWRGYIELARPANVATALADVLAGFAVTGLANRGALPGLLLATACLYAGGVILNDVFDRNLDQQERPERAIPSGRVSVRGASIAAVILLGIGLVSAGLAATDGGPVALGVVAAVVLYNAWSKHRPLAGPLNMGLCRGLNFWLGMAASPGTIADHGLLGLLPMAYIAAVTLLSRGEVHGGDRATATVAITTVVGVIAALTILSVGAEVSVTGALLLTTALAWRIVPALDAARRIPSADTVRHAVRTGVLSLVLLDGVIAAAYAGMIYSLALLATAFLAGRLAREFAVT